MSDINKVRASATYKGCLLPMLISAIGSISVLVWVF